MDFIVVRLGKDSVFDIRKLNATSATDFEPYTLEFTCKQVERAIQPGTYVLIYLGSDNNKGIATDWNQGIRAIGKLEEIEGWENFQSTCTLRIEVFSVFDQSYDQFSFLEESSNLYKHFSKYPIIGVKSSRNNSVQKVNEGLRESSSALLTAIDALQPDFRGGLELRAPELISLLDFTPDNEGSAEESDIRTRLKIEGSSRGANLIFYGAPGTGKSFAIDKTIDPNHSVKTVFHAETMSSDFVGSIRPVMHDDESEKRSLTYEYLPGPFVKCLVRALNDKNNHYWLVIEEINRASAAAVFGEVFQLLDRRYDGRSTYEIDFPDPLSEQFVNSNLESPLEKIFIPANLSILASMNSSDQGVLPLDTAFKRRWQFTYIPLDFDKGCTQGKLPITLEDDVLRTVSWSEFAIAVNEILASSGIPEDRHLGPYFLSTDDLDDPGLALTGKLFMYLWDDVLRHGLRNRLFDSGVRTYGHLIARWEDQKRVFSDDFIGLFGDSPTETEVDQSNG
jgi:hypothetical protein